MEASYFKTLGVFKMGGFLCEVVVILALMCTHAYIYIGNHKSHKVKCI